MPSQYPFWMGGVAASMAASCTHPLDLARVRMQTIQVAPGGRTPNTFSVIYQSVVKNGFRSLYAGLSASLLRQMSYSMVRLGAYENLKGRLSKDGTPSTTNLILAAAFAGALGGIAGNPADILMVRMTSDAIKPPEQRYGYSNALSGLFQIVKQEGVRGLTRGIEANTIRAILLNSSQVVSYDFFKNILLRNPIPIVNYQLNDGLLLQSLASVLAGTVATTVCAPADVLKSRLMSSNSNHNILHVLTTSIREEGAAVLFKGWTPAFVRLGPNTVFLFVFFEQLKSAWDKVHP